MSSIMGLEVQLKKTHRTTMGPPFRVCCSGFRVRVFGCGV